jgi:hypothetical protein
MRITKRHMRLQRNQQRTTTNQSPFRNKKIRKSSHHHRRHRHQRNRHGTTSPKNESILRLRRNRQKRPNPTPRRPPRKSRRIPTQTNGLPQRKHRNPLDPPKHNPGDTDQHMPKLQNLRDTLKNLKHAPPTPRLCPKCHSPKIQLSTRFDGWLLPLQYVCQQCGYKGPIILELEKTEQEPENQNEKEPP